MHHYYTCYSVLMAVSSCTNIHHGEYFTAYFVTATIYLLHIQDSVVFCHLSMHSMHCVFFLNQHCPPILPLLKSVCGKGIFIECTIFRNPSTYVHSCFTSNWMLWAYCIRKVVLCYVLYCALDTLPSHTIHVSCMCVVYSCCIVHTLSFSAFSKVFQLSIISFINKMLVNCCVYSIAVYLLWKLRKWNPLSLLYHWSCSNVFNPIGTATQWCTNAFGRADV